MADDTPTNALTTLNEDEILFRDSVAEFADAALMKVLAVDGRGFAPIPMVVAGEAINRYELERVGSTQECKEQFYAITAERRIVHPAAVVITRAAQARDRGPPWCRDRGRLRVAARAELAGGDARPVCARCRYPRISRS